MLFFSFGRHENSAFCRREKEHRSLFTTGGNSLKREYTGWQFNRRNSSVNFFYSLTTFHQSRRTNARNENRISHYFFRILLLPDIRWDTSNQLPSKAMRQWSDHYGHSLKRSTTEAWERTWHFSIALLLRMRATKRWNCYCHWSCANF